MKIDMLIAEIGSTTTVVNGFDDLESPNPKFIGQGFSKTTVQSGDVNIGLERAIDDFKKKSKIDSLSWEDFFATSSAAGGLRMTVHGLVYDMTVRAAREAALGAGAIIKYVTSGKLRNSDLKKIIEVNPNLILIAGGVDYGERETALYNAELISCLSLKSPVIYAGNIENHEDIKSMFKDSGKKLYLTENVYPKIDFLNIEPSRKIIQAAFEEHITNAPGMKKVREIVNGPIIPTPGAVMEAAMILYETIGDLMVLDVGGATTDVHSVTSGSEEIQRILISPEPLAKRTVEGDLGVFVNMANTVDRIGYEKLKAEFGEDFELLLKNPKQIPESETEIRIVEALTQEAVNTAVERHCGKLRYLYGISGKKTMAEGKDLTGIKYIIGTGGALTRLPDGINIIKNMLLSGKETQLWPGRGSKVLIDTHYIMSSLGIMQHKYKKAASILLAHSLGL